MSYQALYRKFRPAQFQDVKGQEHIVTTLKNQIKANRIGHAYLFCGTRGTGKTTIAKIFAKAVNCEKSIDGSPCGECKSCKTIAAGASMNVIEIDAASNNGVDNIREIVDEISYSPAEGKYKVYIIDEVHMLSIGAFNALLKTLEEPPSYAIFVLATTEVHKIPITILSRCQRYDFKRISIETIVGRLIELIEEENVEVEEKALRYIAKTADGAMRDALSLLDQCIAFHFEKKLTYDMVLDVLGAVDSIIFSKMLRYMIEKDVIGCITLLEEIVMQGRELTQFVSEMTWYLRNLLLVKSSENAEEVIEVSHENMLLLREESQLLKQNTIMRYIRIFSELSGQMRYASAKRILLEMTLIKVCRPSMEANDDSLIERVRDLEKKIEEGVPMALAGTVSNSTQVAMPKERPPLPKAIPEDIKMLVSKWQVIVGRAMPPMKQYLQAAKLSLAGDNRLMVVLEDGLPSDYFIKSAEHKQALEKLLSDEAGKEVEVQVQSIARSEDFNRSYIDLSKIICMEIEETEE